MVACRVRAGRALEAGARRGDQSVGLVAAVEPAIRKYRGRAVLGTSDVVPDAPEPTASTPYPRTALIPQWRVEEILRERLGELGVTVEYGSELAGLKQDTDGVHACLQNRERVRERLVLLCHWW
jgi:2-polyprenyl-6-methoxyphenol hydroxylase-like FAD-dependent oxidoreductase